MIRPTLAVLLVLLASCGSILGPDRGALRATVDGAEIVLENRTSAPVFAFAVEESTLALINWIPCADVERCDPLAPGARRRLPPERIVGYAADPHPRDVVIFWWHAVPDFRGGARAGPVRTLSVRPGPAPSPSLTPTAAAP